MVPQYLDDCQLAAGLWFFLEAFCLHLADELTTESVDDTGDGRLLALANEVEVKHTLDGLGLHSAKRLLGMFSSSISQDEAGALHVPSFGAGKLTRRNILSWGGRACGRAGE